MRVVAEAVGWKVSTDPAPDGSMRVVLQSSLSPSPDPVKPLKPEEVTVSPTVAPEPTKDEEIVLSVVFGTYQRFDVLKRAIDSIRSSVEDIPYELCICDGGSDDGTREWLAEQKDVVLVGKRSLDGAVDAFNHAFRVARGRYIANFNDDAIVQGNAYAEAVRYMDANLDVGQAIFAFRGAGEDYVINQIYPGQDGTEYANFGITRKDTLEQIAYIQGGMWNPIYRTYAADCEASAWCHRLGWRVARLDHLHIVDVRTKDNLRTKNESRQAAETKLMYYRWPREAFRPDGPPPRVSSEEMARYEAVKSRRVVENPAPRTTAHVYAEVVGLPYPEEEDRLWRQGRALRALDLVEGKFPARVDVLPSERVLYVHLETKADPQAGLDRALRKLGSGGYAKVAWMEYEYGPRQTAIVEAAAKLKPTFIFLQLQTPNAVSPETIRRVREVVSDPNLVIATWNGDIADVNSPHNMQWMVGLGRVCDLSLHASNSHVKAMRSIGVHNSQFLNIGFDPAQYHEVEEDDVVGMKTIDDMRTYDICFLGSKYANNGDTFSASLKWHDAGLRNDAVLAMKQTFGDRFGLYGRGWGGEEKAVALSEAHTVYWRSKIGLNVSLANYMEAYSSDRLHRILGCGCLLLTKRFPLMSVYGLNHGTNCLIWDTPSEALNLAKQIVKDPNKLLEMAKSGNDLAKNTMTWDSRMFELSAHIRLLRSSGRS